MLEQLLYVFKCWLNLWTRTFVLYLFNYCGLFLDKKWDRGTRRRGVGTFRTKKTCSLTDSFNLASLEIFSLQKKTRFCRLVLGALMSWPLWYFLKIYYNITFFYSTVFFKSTNVISQRKDFFADIWLATRPHDQTPSGSATAHVSHFLAGYCKMYRTYSVFTLASLISAWYLVSYCPTQVTVSGSIPSCSPIQPYDKEGCLTCQLSPWLSVHFFKPPQLK